MEKYGAIIGVRSGVDPMREPPYFWNVYEKQTGSIVNSGISQTEDEAEKRSKSAINMLI